MEHVILLDAHANAIGSAPKHEVHTADTPLHLAFSCYVFDASGRLLVTRRALTKLTWPGVWTNSFCGHPAPNEAPVDALHRRAREELGTRVRDVRSLLPHFRYRAVDASGIVENEICPVWCAVLDDSLDPRPAEVVDWAWIDVAELTAATAAAPFAFSPWLIEQLPEIGAALAAIAHELREQCPEGSAVPHALAPPQPGART